MQIRTRGWSIFVAVLVLSCWLSTPDVTLSDTTNDAVRSSWKCLPDSTAVALRVPDGARFFEELKETTKLGAVAFDEQRLDGVVDVLVSQPSWKPVEEQLERYGMSPNDLPRFLAGEIGFALVLPVDDWDEIGESEVAPMGLLWCDPAPGLGERLWNIIGELIEVHQDDEFAVVRRDIEIADQPAMLLAIPQKEYEWSAPSDDEEDGAMVMTVGYQHAMLTLHEGRLLAAFTFEPVEDSEDADVAETLTRVFEPFVLAHADGSGSFVSRMESIRGVREALPQHGVTMLEAFVDLKPLIEMALHEDLDEESGDDLEKRRRILQATGADQLGVVAARMSLAGSALRAGYFVQAPSPRTKLLKLLDQPALEARPPRWVPTTAVEYSHMSLDLGAVYRAIRTFVVQHVDADTDERFKVIDTAVTGHAGVGLEDVLSSLGHKHLLVEFEPRLEGAEEESDEPFKLSERQAVVWSIENQEIWDRILASTRPLTAALGGVVEYAEEQGFAGYRSTNPSFEGGLFLGKGYLVLAVGEGILSQTLSMLNHPPEGRDALVRSDIYAKAAELLPLEPGLFFQVGDGNRYAGVLHDSLLAMLDMSLWELGMEDDDEAENRERTVEQLRELFPERDEFEGLLGISVSYARMTDDGLEVKQVSQLPAP